MATAKVSKVEVFLHKNKGTLISHLIFLKFLLGNSFFTHDA